MPAPALYRRVLLDLRHAGRDPGGIRAAAELARLLDLALTGVFVEDAALHGLSEYRFTRELRLPGHEWHALDPLRLGEEMRIAAAAARRMLDEHCAASGVLGLFEHVRGHPADALAALAEASDILVRIEPATAAERLAHRLLPAPVPRTAATLLVPRRVRRHHGAIAVVVTRATEAGLLTAAALAAASGERLLLLLLPPDDAALQAAAIAVVAAAGVPAERIQTRPLRAATPDAILQALGKTAERLLVLTRGAEGLDDPAPQHLAAARAVPVLLVAPGTEAAPLR